MRVYLHHVRGMPIPGRRSGYCTDIRKFAQRHNLSIRQFAAEGIDAEVLLATGDAMAIKVVEYVKSLEQQSNV
jgi:hypothetical protein